MLELSSISKSFADALVLDNLNLTVAPYNIQYFPFLIVFLFYSNQ